MIGRLWVLSGLVAVGCSDFPKPDSTIDCDAPSYAEHPAAERLRAFVDDRVARGLPGFALAVRTPEGVWQGAAGYADIEGGVEMSTCHVHPMASVGKTWHATLALLLAERGLLDLDAPISSVLDEDTLHRLPNAEVVTFRQLMDHSSGMTDFNEDLAYLGFEFDGSRDPRPPDELLDWVRGDAPLFEPGQGYHYTDTEYVLLAMAMDAITGDLVGTMRADLLDPLGMAHTSLPRVGDPDPEGRVNAYWEIGGGRISNISALQAKYDVQVIGAGNVRTTLTDALAFADAVARGPLLSDESRDEMQQWNPSSVDAEGHGYGLGLARRQIDGVTWVGHTGGDVGAGAFLFARPDAEVSMVGMTNLGMFLGGPLSELWNDETLVEIAGLLD
ncbi:MAG: beta-lactamase family protein [Alphaproteobacteria bacterium]|nr:beta-lactamase family protein [Alphaproteobacteria bacterium]